jgi:hypothetical protein
MKNDKPVTINTTKAHFQIGRLTLVLGTVEAVKKTTRLVLFRKASSPDAKDSRTLFVLGKTQNVDGKGGRKLFLVPGKHRPLSITMKHGGV